MRTTNIFLVLKAEVLGCFEAVDAFRKEVPAQECMRELLTRRMFEEDHTFLQHNSTNDMELRRLPRPGQPDGASTFVCGMKIESVVLRG